MEVISELSDLEVIKYNNNLKENDEEEKKPIDIDFTEQKTDPCNENAIDFRLSDVKEENREDIALVNFIESLQKQADEVY